MIQATLQVGYFFSGFQTQWEVGQPSSEGRILREPAYDNVVLSYLGIPWAV